MKINILSKNSKKSFNQNKDWIVVPKSMKIELKYQKSLHKLQKVK